MGLKARECERPQPHVGWWVPASQVRVRRGGSWEETEAREEAFGVTEGQRLDIQIFWGAWEPYSSLVSLSQDWPWRSGVEAWRLYL